MAKKLTGTNIAPKQTSQQANWIAVTREQYHRIQDKGNKLYIIIPS